MRFIVYDDVFETLPNLYLRVVMGYGIDNTRELPEIEERMKLEMAARRAAIEEKNLKEHPAIAPYREAFLHLGINPNKYMSSIEAMTKRVLKGNDLPSINPVVNLCNALSLKYILPMGAHDVDQLTDEIAIRFSKEGDLFQPLGTEEIERLPEGELIYADGAQVRTRRWIWRQNNRGKIDEKSKNIFFPIDGFADKNKEAVDAAAEELERLLQQTFHCSTKKFFVDASHRSVEI